MCPLAGEGHYPMENLGPRNNDISGVKASKQENLACLGNKIPSTAEMDMPAVQTDSATVRWLREAIYLEMHWSFVSDTCLRWLPYLFIESMCK